MNHENLDWKKGHVCPVDGEGLCADCPCHRPQDQTESWEAEFDKAFFEITPDYYGKTVYASAAELKAFIRSLLAEHIRKAKVREVLEGFEAIDYKQTANLLKSRLLPED